MMKTKQELLNEGLNMFTAVDIPSNQTDTQKQLMSAFIECVWAGGAHEGMKEIEKLITETRI